jgi:hypothetical protein
MGDLGKTMKKIGIFLFCFFACVHADPKVGGLKQRVCNVLPSLEGWCSQEKAINFIDLILEIKPTVYVEIGVWGGSSIFPVASALKFLGQGVVYAIDPWDRLECVKYYDPVEDEADLKWWNKVNINYARDSYYNMLKKYGLEKYVTTLPMTSELAAYQIDEIDILYIDGNHCEIPTVNDVMIYLPKVKKGGYIWMNDSSWTSRQAGVVLLSESCDVIKLIDGGNCILFRKR